MHFVPDRTNSRPRAPEAPSSASGGGFARVANKAWPNPLLKPTRNGMRQSAGEVSFAHYTSPAACHMPPRAV